MLRFYECPVCGFLHADGESCRDARFEPEELDELHPDGWEEIDVDTPNLFRLQLLTPETDLEGRQLTVGCRVRIYDGAWYLPETDETIGTAIASAEKISYTEGRLEAIGATVEGSDGPRYVIKIETEHYIDRRPGAKQVHRTVMSNWTCTPPVNGSPTVLGWPTFAVFRLTQV